MNFFEYVWSVNCLVFRNFGVNDLFFVKKLTVSFLLIKTRHHRCGLEGV